MIFQDQGGDKGKWPGLTNTMAALIWEKFLTCLFELKFHFLSFFFFSYCFKPMDFLTKL